MKLTAMLVLILATIGLCAQCVTAKADTYDNTNAGSSISGSPSNTQNVQQYKISKLQNEIQTLQGNITTLQRGRGSSSQGPKYVFSVAPIRNHDGSPIPNGDYPLGW
jgi:peptidoglycan hydrolase CwlO-like protein